MLVHDIPYLTKLRRFDLIKTLHQNCINISYSLNVLNKGILPNSDLNPQKNFLGPSS